MDIKKVGEYCKEYRRDILGYSLTDFCKLTNSNIKNVSAFESGRANKIDYMFLYSKAIKDKDKRVDFLRKLLQIK